MMYRQEKGGLGWPLLVRGGRLASSFNDQTLVSVLMSLDQGQAPYSILVHTGARKTCWCPVRIRVFGGGDLTETTW
jgi:hypothetical protein